VSENVTSGGTATPEALEELLRQLVDARFVLMDREGSITRWSGPAEELFGWQAAGMIGQPLRETLDLADALPEDGGHLQTTSRRKDGTVLEVALTLVPVGMSQSLEFNGFLEALEIVHPQGNALRQLQQSHRSVVDRIGAALGGAASLGSDDNAAGTIVAFRPLVEPVPAPEEEPAEPLDRAAAEAARITLLEERNDTLGSELADARSLLDGMRAEMEVLRRELSDARSTDEERARADRDVLAELRETRARMDEQERLRAELEATRAEVETLAGEQIEERRALAAELADARTQLEALRERLEQAQVAAVGDDVARSLIEDLREEVAALRAMAAGSRESREQVDLAREAAVAAAEAQLVVARETAASVEARASRAQDFAAAAERHAGRAEDAVAGATAHADRAQQAAAAAEADAGRVYDAVADAEVHAGRAREAVEALAGRAESAVAAAERHAARAIEAAGAAESHAVQAGEWAVAERQDDRRSHRPLIARRRSTGPARARRPGFDDAELGLAIIELDGHFRELNPSFSELVGYSEDEFSVASWPPVMDRANLEKHRREMRDLLAGRLDSVEVNTGYVHAQGLAVPVNGRISLVREDGEPSHFLLEVDVP
jgi:PAS domain S-box-containing protein